MSLPKVHVYKDYQDSYVELRARSEYETMMFDILDELPHWRTRLRAIQEDNATWQNTILFEASRPQTALSKSSWRELIGRRGHLTEPILLRLWFMEEHASKASARLSPSTPRSKTSSQESRNSQRRSSATFSDDPLRYYSQEPSFSSGTSPRTLPGSLSYTASTSGDSWAAPPSRHARFKSPPAQSSSRLSRTPPPRVFTPQLQTAALPNGFGATTMPIPQATQGVNVSAVPQQGVPLVREPVPGDTLPRHPYYDSIPAQEKLMATPEQLIIPSTAITDALYIPRQPGITVQRTAGIPLADAMNSQPPRLAGIPEQPLPEIPVRRDVFLEPIVDPLVPRPQMNPAVALYISTGMQTDFGNGFDTRPEDMQAIRNRGARRARSPWRASAQNAPATSPRATILERAAPEGISQELQEVSSSTLPDRSSSSASISSEVPPPSSGSDINVVAPVSQATVNTPTSNDSQIPPNSNPEQSTSEIANPTNSTDKSPAATASTPAAPTTSPVAPGKAERKHQVERKLRSPPKDLENTLMVRAKRKRDLSQYKNTVLEETCKDLETYRACLLEQTPDRPRHWDFQVAYYPNPCLFDDVEPSKRDLHHFQLCPSRFGSACPLLPSESSPRGKRNRVRPD